MSDKMLKKYTSTQLNRLSTKEIQEYQAEIQIQIFKITAELMLRGKM